MMKIHSFASLSLFLLLLLAACAPGQPEQPAASAIAVEPTVADSASPEILPTDTLPVSTEAPPEEIPAHTPEPLPTNTPPSQPSEGATHLQLALINSATDILLWRASDQTLTTLLGASGAIDLRLSDDGTRIAYRKDIDIGQQELWAVNTDGTNARLLLSIDDLRALDPEALGVFVAQYEWIPDTHTLAFNTIEYVEAPGQFLNDDLYFLDVDTNELTIQLTPGSGGNFLFSPDGLQYAIIQPEAISLLNTDGSNIRSDVLTYPYVLTYSEYNYYAEPHWSPDSTFLRVAIPPQDSLGDPTALTTLWHIPTDGSPAALTGEVLAQPFFIDPVRFSPDLTRLAYTRLPDSNDYLNAELVLANAEGGEETVYAAGNIFFSGWAPNSRQFIFADSLLQATYLGETGVEYVLLAANAALWEVTWLDELHYLYFTQEANRWQMWVATLNSERVAVLSQPDYPPIYDFDN